MLIPHQDVLKFSHINHWRTINDTSFVIYKKKYKKLNKTKRVRIRTLLLKNIKMIL